MSGVAGQERHRCYIPAAAGARATADAAAVHGIAGTSPLFVRLAFFFTPTKNAGKTS